MKTFNMNHGKKAMTRLGVANQKKISGLAGQAR